MEEKQYKYEKYKNWVLLGVPVIILLFEVISLWNRISPLHYVDGIAMLDRMMFFKSGVMDIDHYLFLKHGNSMHTIVYAVALLDAIFNHSLPVLMKALMFLGISASALIFVNILGDKKDKFDYIATGIFICIFVGGCFADQLFLPFQIGLSLTRPVFMLVFLMLSNHIIERKNNSEYILITLFACLAAILHGIGIMFAGAYVYVHLIHRQGKCKTAISFIPFVLAVIIQIVYNGNFGEISSSNGSYLIRHFIPFIKSIIAYYSTPFGSLRISRTILLILGTFAFMYTIFKILHSLFYGLGINKFARLPENIRNRTVILTKQESFMLGLLGISILSALSSAMFAAARMDFIPSIAKDPTGYTLMSTRYACFSVVPYIYMFWAFLRIKWEKRYLKMISRGLVLITLLMVIGANNYLTSYVKHVNGNLDLAACGLLTGIPPEDEKIVNSVWPGYTSDWYWKDEVSKLFVYYQQNQEYIWEGVPKIGSAVLNSAQSQQIQNISKIDSTDIKYQLITGTATKWPSTRYAAILDLNGTVIGFAYVESMGGLYRKKDDGKIYYDDKLYLKGYILSSAKDSPFYTIKLD